jgi:mycothiol system anti-sigma-R factor
VSCGKPHETPCSEVLEDVYIYLDEECDGVSTSKIKQHLEECGPCLQQYGIEQEVKALVARCCGQEVAPDSLRQRLKATLAQIVVTDSYVEVTTIEVTTDSE